MDGFKKTKIGIVGGGIQGLALAYYLSKNGKCSVTLFERNKNLGGLLGLLEIEGTPIEGFYHHWFTSHTEIIELAKELGLEKNLMSVRNKIGLFYNDRIYPFNGAKDVLLFSPISFLSRTRLGLSAFFLTFKKSCDSLENKKAAEWLKKYCGKEAYQVVWEPLLKGKFGNFKKDISMAWFWGRIHERGNSPILIYPRRGFKGLIDAMTDRIKKKGNLIKTGVSIEYIAAKESGVAINSNGGEEIFDKVFVTTPISVFLKLTRGLPEEYIKRLELIRYRAAHVTVLVLKKSLLSDNYYWLNINDRSIPLLAVVEHTNLIPKEDYGNKTIVYLANYPDPNDPVMTMTDENLIEMYSRFLPKINPDFKKEWIEKYYIFKDPNAQPVVGIDYKNNIPPVETPIPNLYLLTMAQIYPWDRGTNNAVVQAKEAAKKYFLTKGGENSYGV